MRNTISLLFVIFILFSLTVPIYSQVSEATDERVSLCLNGDWLRCPGDENQIPETGWKVVRVPEAPETVLEGAAWFRMDFEFPSTFKSEDKMVYIRFNRVRHYARVFLNGHNCGENFGGRAPFELNVTKYMKPDQSNRLEVWVHNCSEKYAMPGKVVNDEETLKRLSTAFGYYKTATIASDVYLEIRPVCHVSQVNCRTSVQNKSLSLNFELCNQDLSGKYLTLKNDVFLGGKKVLELPDQVVSMPAGSMRQLDISASWNDPELWGFPPYGKPTLYHLETKLINPEGKIIDRLVTRFGFKEIWTHDGSIILNGKPIRILGYWQPEGSGRQLWTMRMAATQWLGCNAIHSHMEQEEAEFYDVADELGLLVWDANFCGGPLGTTQNMSDKPFPEVEAELGRQYQLWTQSLQNHPSVSVLFVSCLFNHDASINLGQILNNNQKEYLLHLSYDNSGKLDLMSYSSYFSMHSKDPLVDIRDSYHNAMENLVKPSGIKVPLVNQEVWYNFRTSEEGEWKYTSEEKIAKATGEAINFYADFKIAGFILYNQEGFETFDEWQNGKLSWPSRSGEGQHSSVSKTAGHDGWPLEYINIHDEKQPVFKPSPTGNVMHQVSSRFTGNKPNIAKKRRPEVLVSIVKNNKPVNNAYVWFKPVDGVKGTMKGMRTDNNGIAWCELRDPGRYQFSCKVGESRKVIEMNAPLQALDLDKGGFDYLLRLKIDFNK